MKAVIGDFSTTIYLSDEEIKEYCKIGQGADCCIWCCVGPDGFECLYYDKPSSLIERWKAGQTNAKRDGCDKVKNFSRFSEGGTVIF